MNDLYMRPIPNRLTFFDESAGLCNHLFCVIPYIVYVEIFTRENFCHRKIFILQIAYVTVPEVANFALVKILANDMHWQKISTWRKCPRIRY